MKTNVLRKLFLFAFLIAGMLQTGWAQEVRLINGRLAFANKAAFERTYTQLDAAVRNSPDGADIRDGEYYDPYPALASFESGLGFNSLRKAELDKLYAQLRGGVDPENLRTLSWLQDPAAQSMLNKDNVLQVVDTIFILRRKNLTIKILHANESIMNQILGGAKPYRFGDQVIMDFNAQGNGCSADFNSSLSFLTSGSGSFTFTGTATSSAMFTWSFGDGTYSSDRNPQKTYSSQGVYEVCLEVEDGDCIDQYCKTIFVNQGCAAFFTYSTPGQPGMICFTDQSIHQNSSITAYQWNFGDGETSQEANPCHRFPCDAEFTVSLTITTSNGCTRSISHKVKVHSFRCCDHDIDESDTKFTYTFDEKHKAIGTAEDVQFLFFSNVNADWRYFKKGLFGWWWPSKANLKVAMQGNVYLKDEKACICQNPYNIDAEDSGHKSFVRAAKHVPGRFKTWKDDPWEALFYLDGNLVRQITVPVTCD